MLLTGVFAYSNPQPIDVDIGLVRFEQVSMAVAFAIALAHNHPSGDPSPSRDDVVLTEAIIEAGALLEVDVLDHLVIGHGRWLSMREQRLGFD